MEQNTSNNPSNTSNTPPPTKKTKLQLEQQFPSPGTTRNQSASTAENLNAANPDTNQQPSNVTTAENLSQYHNGIFNFILPSEEDSARASKENPDPNSAGLTNSRTDGVWNRSREEAHSAHAQERSPLGHLITSEETQKNILEADIFRILQSEGVTEIGALYKVSPSKFVLAFGSQAAREKLQNTEIQCRFGDQDLRLSFYKRVGPFRSGREPIFVTAFLPEFVSDQAVRLAFSNFGEVISVFKGKHKFNKNIRNGRRHVKIFPAGGDPGILPRKITFHGRIQRDVLFAEKVVLCYRCKIRHMLGENCPVVTPAQEDSSMSLPEQSGVTVGGAALVQQESSNEIQSSTESQQASSPTCGEDEEGFLPGRMSLPLAPIRIQPQSLTMRVSLTRCPRGHLLLLRMILLTCLLGRMCLLYGGLRRTRSRALTAQKQFLPRRRTKPRTNLKQWKNKALRLKILPNH